MNPKPLTLNPCITPKKPVPDSGPRRPGNIRDEELGLLGDIGFIGFRGTLLRDIGFHWGNSRAI